MSESRIIPVAEPFLGEAEISAVTDAVRSGWVSSKGRYVDEFEQAFKDITGARHAISTTSGTTALHLVLVALGIGPGDEVIVPTYSFVATAASVRYVGATPVCADSAPGHWCIDPDDIERRITPRTKAIMPVHLLGHPADMDRIGEIARKHGLTVIENACEALGASVRGRPVGNLGHVSVFSFFGNKLITTGEGGMVVTDDDDLADHMRLLRNQAMDPTRHYWHPEVGFNYRLTNLQSALGVAQAKRIPALLSRKRDIAERYQAGLAGLPGITFQQTATWATNSWWMFTVLVGPESGTDRDHLAAELRERGVDSRPALHCIHEMPPYRTAGSFPVADRISREGLSLPSGVTLVFTEQAHVIASIRSILTPLATATISTPMTATAT